MPITTLTSKGQVTLPKEIRNHLRVGTGDRLDFAIGPDGSVRVRPLKRDVRELYGLFHRPGIKPLTVDEMDDAIAQHLAEEDERIRRGES